MSTNPAKLLALYDAIRCTAHEVSHKFKDTASDNTHFHVCERCAEIWCHTKTHATPEEREKIHRCPRCTAGPYITAYQTRRDANEVRQLVRNANTAALAAEGKEK